MTKTKLQPKFDLSRNVAEQLKLYLFIARPGNVNIPGERVSLIIAYTFDDAFARAKMETPNFNIVYHDQKIPIKELIERIELGQSIVPEAKSEPLEPLKPPKLTEEQIIWHIIGNVDKYLEKEKGKKKQALKDLIEYLASKVGKSKTNKKEK